MDIYTFFSFGFLEKDKHFGTSRDKILDKQYETDGVLIDYCLWVSDFGVDFWECMQKSEAAAMETSRASVVAMNAEIRRAKARMMEEVPKLQKLALKKVKY